jgi:hypothetical protein
MCSDVFSFAISSAVLVSAIFMAVVGFVVIREAVSNGFRGAVNTKKPEEQE